MLKGDFGALWHCKQLGKTIEITTPYAGLFQLANAGAPNASGIVEANGNYYYSYSLDPFLPFEENYLFRNFVFSPANADNTGSLTTGVTADSSSSPNDFISFSSSPTFNFQISLTNSIALLTTSATHWLFYDQSAYGSDLFFNGLITATDAGSNGKTISVASGILNWFGLPYTSVNIASQSHSSGNLVTNVVPSGGSLTSLDFPSSAQFYPEILQPKFRTAEYDFWMPVWTFPTNPYVTVFPPDALPGQLYFSVTNKSRFLITSVGNAFFQVASYAKLEVTNSFYSGVYGYLGQYFDRACMVGDNGIATTNATGVLSPYGNFFATEPGTVALVTMPDVDTGQRGTGVVYCVSLNVDKNHDGSMDVSFNGADATSQNSPMEFWVNNNFDRVFHDEDDNADYEDDVSRNSYAAFSPYNNHAPTADCDYRTTSGTRVIPTRRDLEDFSRLWLSGVTTNLLNALPSGSTVTLSWNNVSGNPTIDLFQAADTDGGIGYLTNSGTASVQVNSTLSPYIGRLGPSNPRQLNYPGIWAGNRFIW